MVFKFILNIFKAFLLVTLLSHCGLYIKETYQDIPLEDTNLGCLNGLGSNFKRYLKKDIPQEEIGQAAHCLKSAVTIFKNHVWGKEVDTYSPEELRDFLQEFFLKDRKIPKNFLNSLMELKVALVGGDVKFLTGEELDQITVKIDLLEKFISDMYPHIDIFYSQKNSSYSEVHKGIEQLKISLNKLSNNLFTQPYSLKSTLKLLEESNEVFNFSEENNFYGFKLFKESVPFMLSSSYSKDVVDEYEWDSLLGMTANVLSIYFYKVHGDQGQEFQDVIRNYSMAIENLIQFLNNRISITSTKTLSVEEIKYFAHHLRAKKLLPDYISLTYMDDFLKNLFHWVLEKSDSQDDSLDLEELNWWKNEYYSWKTTQNSIDYLKGWLEKNKSYSVQDVFQNESLSSSEPFNNSLKNIYSLYHHQILYDESSSDLNIHYTYPSNRFEGFRYKNLTIHNAYSHIWNVVIKRYAKRYLGHGLTSEELGAIIEKATILLQLFKGEKGEVEPNDGSLEFMISNILLYSTEGYYKPHYYMDYNKKTDILFTAEGIELLPLYLQIQKSSHGLFQFLKSNCSSIDQKCFKNYIAQYILENMNYAPHLQDFIQQLRGNSLLVDYVDSLAQILRVGGPIDNIQKDQIDFIFYSIFLQEMTITRFDKNKNGVIEQKSKDESELLGEEDSMFNLWEGFIEYGQKNIMCLEEELGEDQARFMFFYIIRNRQLMDIETWHGKLNVGYNYIFPFLFSSEIELTRLEIMELLANLSTSVKSVDTFCPDE